MNKEEYDKLKAEKEKQKITEKKKTKVIPIIIGISILGLLGAGIFTFVSKPKIPPKPDLSQAMPYEGATHVAEGTKVEYISNPPTSGNHWPVPLKSGIYEKEKPDEAIVHSLEHGRVWISYKPSLAQSAKETLRKIAQKDPLVILTPRAKNDTDIALSAWKRLDIFNFENGLLDEKRITNFIRTYKNRSPESVPGEMGTSEYENY